MEVCHKQELYLLWIDCIQIGKHLDTLPTLMETTVKQDLPAFALEVNARSAYLTARAEGSDLKDLATLDRHLACHAIMHLLEVYHLHSDLT